MLRTPSAIEGEGGAIREDVARAKNRMLQVRDQMGQLAAENGLKVPYSLMPTPTTRDYKDGQAEHSRDGIVQTDTVARAIFSSGEVSDISWGKFELIESREIPVLGTVTTATSGRSSEFRKGANPTIQEMVDDAQGEPITSWGKFEPAIRRWEQTLSRPAPAPTRPDGRDGNHRLSPEFTEWMMGLPDGWITDCGLTRNEELKACGNGVVPQQAELALRHLLEGIPLPTGGGQVNLPTPTVMDQRDGKHFRTVAIKNLSIGLNRGINLNNVVEAIGVDWQPGDTFTMTKEGLKKDDN
jgi:hypothetical protein